MFGPGVPAQVRLALNALPTAAQSNGPPKMILSSSGPEPVPVEPVVVAPPEEPVLCAEPLVMPADPVSAGRSIGVASRAAEAVPPDPPSKVAPTRAARTAERFT